MAVWKKEECRYIMIARREVRVLSYRKAIHELVERIHSESSLRRIYKLVLFLYEKEDD